MNSVLKKIEDHDIRFIRCIWSDNANIIRAKAIHKNILKENVEYPVSISAAQQSVPAIHDVVVNGSGLTPVGEIFLKPDWSTLKILPYSQSHASVICDLYKNEKPWEHCPRTFLKRMIYEAEKLGLKIKASFENEFYLYKKDEKGNVVVEDNTLFAMFNSYELNENIINKISDQLDQQGLKVLRYYPESGYGQHEFSIEHRDALEAADNQIHFRNTVHANAIQNEMTANFMAKPFADLAGNGCHIHISIEKEGMNIFEQFNNICSESDLAKNAIAGILHHLPSLMAITTPGTNSFKRIKPHFWSGAFNCWGVDNREAAVRVITKPNSQQISHFELKTSDATSNPYLALGMIIAVMLYGINNKLMLSEPVDCDPGHLSGNVLKQKKINALPEDFDVALYQYYHNSYFRETMGELLFNSYYAVKKYELEHTVRYKIDEERNLFENKY